MTPDEYRTHYAEIMAQWQAPEATHKAVDALTYQVLTDILKTLAAMKSTPVVGKPTPDATFKTHAKNK